jgi:CheY-like chemotaxis protein
VSGRILIVEDDQELRDLLQIVLREEGFEVESCENGQLAMDRLREGKKNHDLPSMVILDLNMPVLDGWEVAARLDADPELKDIPVIVSSASKEQGEKAKKLHADAYLVKPFTTDEILGIVELFSLLS